MGPTPTAPLSNRTKFFAAFGRATNLSGAPAHWGLVRRWSLTKDLVAKIGVEHATAQPKSTEQRLHKLQGHPASSH